MPLRRLQKKKPLRLRPRGRLPEATAPLDGKTAADLRAELVMFLARRTRDATLAEDLAQQALVQVLAGLPRFRGNATLRTWVRRIALNVWHDHARRQAASPAVRAARGDSFSVTALLDALGPAPPVAPVEDALDRRATQHCLFDAIRQLPADARRILLLHDYGDMPLEEVASALGCSVGAAKVRLHRARRLVAERCRVDCVSDVGADGTVLCTPRGGANPPVERPPRKAAPRRRK